MNRPPTRLGILLSGRGSNFQAIHQALLAGELPNAEIMLVASNKLDAQGIAYARAHGINTVVLSRKAFPDNAAFDAALLKAFRHEKVDILVLAGYTRILTPVLLEAYPGRILNIHPSLLPAYGGRGMWGMAVHEAVMAAQETYSGCTVHLVTEAVDEGPILGTAEVPVFPQDTPETLAERVLAAEHKLYPDVLKQFIASYRENSCHAPS